jgi:3,4-dihydroxy 2-butanone 4-phosphate synthase/GTP cyclohydrolase II
MSLADIPTALDALRAGRPVIVVDDESRENEGDVVLAAQFASQEWLAWLVRNSSGFICAPMTNEIADRLELPIMVPDNQDPRGTNYTVSVDAANRLSTGISASDRAHTLRVLADLESVPASLHRPGHIMPLRAAEGGVRGLIELGEREGVAVITIAALIEHLNETQPGGEVPLAVDIPESSRVIFEVETTVPTTHGEFRFRAYRDRTTGYDHLAVIAGEPADGALIRVHSECLTGEVFGSLKCECGPQLDAALDAIQRSSEQGEGGVVIYMRGHEGRGIGLINKLKAYRLQEEGLDTLDANIALGFPADGRDYAAAAAILADLGISSVRAITNNPEKLRQLAQHGITVTEQVPLVVGVGSFNEGYLEAKRDRMGHILPSNAVLDEAVLVGKGPLAGKKGVTL